MSDNSDIDYADKVYFDITQFLSEYEKIPCLWDRTHKYFKDRRERIIAEETLGEKLGIMDLTTLRKKIRSVRGTYNTEIRKVRLSLDNRGVMYIPRLSWFPLADKFLRVTTDIPPALVIPQGESEVTYNTPKKKLLQKLPRKTGVTVVTVRKPKSKLKSITSKLTEDLFEEDEEDMERPDTEFDQDEETLQLDDHNDEVDIENLKCENSDSISDNNSNSDDFQNRLLLETNDTYCSSSEDKPIEKRKITKRQYNSEKYLVNIVKSLKEIQQTSENEFAAFGRSVGIQLQNMPLDIAIQIQTDIQAHITRTRLEYMKRKKETDKA